MNTPKIPLKSLKSLIESNRVVLRSITENDANDIYNAICNSLQSLRGFPATMPWALDEPSLEKSREFCEFAVSSRKNSRDLIYVIRPKESEGLIGTIGLHRINWTVPRFEIGFWCHSIYQRQGLMREAAESLLEHLHKTHSPRRIEAIVDEENTHARNLCSRLGFSLEGIHINAKRDPKGRCLRNLCVYAIVCDDATAGIRC